MRSTFLTALTVFLATLTLACATQQSTTIPEPEPSIEYKLAAIDRGTYVASDDIAVARFRSLLEQLSTKYGETPQRIADVSVKGRTLLREKGLDESIQNMMEGMNQVLDRPIGNQKYPDYLGLYVMLRNSGKTHTEAIGNMSGALRELGVQ
jgi:hypothetical protein